METVIKNPHPDVQAIVAGRSILVRLPKNQPDIAFIRSLGYARWDTSGFCWVVQNHPSNTKRLNDYFTGRIRWHEPLAVERKKQVNEVQVEPKTLLVVRFRNSRIRLIFCYDPEMVVQIKLQPLYSWDQDTKSWTLPHTENILARLSHFCSTHGWKYQYSEDKTQMNRKPKPSSVSNYRKCPDVFRERMIVLRYSPRTIQVYVDCFSEFLNYYPGKEPADITQDEIIKYLRYLIEERCISTSY